MFKPLALYIGLRYTRAKKSNHFISFISLSSMIGIAMGVMVLITVLSVMNGFDSEIHKKFFGMAPEVTITYWNNKLQNWKKLENYLKELPNIAATAPYINSQGLLLNSDQIFPVIITGINPNQEKNISNLQHNIILGSLNKLNDFNIIIGQNLADNLGAIIGDKITIMLPKTTVTPAGIIPRFKRFTVVGIFSAGSGFSFDSKFVFINLLAAQKLFSLNDGVTGIRLKLNNVYEAPELSEQLYKILGEKYQINNWTQQFGDFFQAIKMEKKMMFLILILIIAIATFNLVSSLVLIVNTKQAEIAILRTIGTTPKIILCIFMVQGVMIGLVGTILGLLSGLLLASNVTWLVTYLQKIFNVQLLSSSIYFIDYLPSQILASDVIQVCAISLLLSFFATIYPALQAAKTIIAEALHYE